MAQTTVWDGTQAAPGEELRSAQEAEALLVELVGKHADELLAIARRNTLCPDDAFDAYQRTLEIGLRHARRLERATAHRWLFRVCRNEALAVARQRHADVGLRDVDFDAFADPSTRSPEERALAGETVDRSAEALKRLKPDELRALWLRASGLSYEEIGGVTGWTRTKVNRCISEGRKRFLQRYAEIETGAECDRWSLVRSAMVDGEAGGRELAAFRPHLRNCAACRATVRELRLTRPRLRVLLPTGLLAPVTPEAGPRPDLVTGWVARLWEITIGVGDRATASAIKLQTAAEAASAGKLAALAASATAVAGGGAAVVSDDARHGHPVAAVRAPALRQAPAQRPADPPRPVVAPQVGSAGGRSRPAAAPRAASRVGSRDRVARSEFAPPSSGRRTTAAASVAAAEIAPEAEGRPAVVGRVEVPARRAPTPAAAEFGP